MTNKQITDALKKLSKCVCKAPASLVGRTVRPAGFSGGREAKC